MLLASFLFGHITQFFLKPSLGSTLLNGFLKPIDIVVGQAKTVLVGDKTIIKLAGVNAGHKINL